MASGTRVAALVVITLLLASACGGADDKPDDCPSTVEAGQQTSTTDDPRCVETAKTSGDAAVGEAWDGSIATDEGGPGMTGSTTGTFSLTVGADGAVTGSGTSHSTYSNSPDVHSQITVTGKREANTFHLTLRHTPGIPIEVVAPIRGTVAEGPIDLTGELGTYSRGQVRLECQDCG
jgi:hypothetical protein